MEERRHAWEWRSEVTGSSLTPFTAGCLAPSLFKATDEPISPINGMEAVLRPFSLVIPFTVQKGQITGATATGAPPPWERRSSLQPLRLPFR